MIEMPPENFTSISIKKETKKRLASLMRYGDSFDSKILELIDEHEKKKK
jgi:hypothetical protein